MKQIKLHFALTLGVLTLCWGTATGARAQNAPAAPAAPAPPTLEEPAGTNADQNPAPAAVVPETPPQESHTQDFSSREMVVYGKDVEVKPDETVDSVVVFAGSAKVHGNVRQDVVVFAGDVEVDGQVNGNITAILGSITLHTNAVTKQNAVAILGDITVQTNATVHQNAVAVGGSVITSKGAKIKGNIVPLAFGPGNIGAPRWLRGWLNQCVFKLRPLALQVPIVWVVAGLFFLLYLFIATVFQKGVRACVDELDRRPATTLLFGLLTKILVPLLLLILAVTGVGVLVVPFVLVALFFGAAVGKVALLQWVGETVGRRFGAPALQKPLLAFLLGTGLLTLFYLTWVVGLLVFLLFSVWGLGVAVTAVFGGLRREAPNKTRPPAPPAEPVFPPGAPVSSAAAFEASATGPTSAFEAAPAAGPSASQTATATAAPVPPPQAPEAAIYPRAGFWERIGAGFLDIVLVGIAAAFVHGPFSFLPVPTLNLLVALAYFAGMWAWRGTTIGGIVLGLKVVRLDHQRLSFGVCLVRALTAAFSAVVLFLGFLWIAWDPEKQAWHDRVAGTVVLRLPRSAPLLCL